jgi:hypothetical protein
MKKIGFRCNPRSNRWRCICRMQAEIKGREKTDRRSLAAAPARLPSSHDVRWHHRYPMGGLPLLVFYLWRHVLSTAPPFILWWWKFEILFDPLPYSSPFSALTTNSNWTQPAHKGGGGLDNLLMTMVGTRLDRALDFAWIGFCKLQIPSTFSILFAYACKRNRKSLEAVLRSRIRAGIALEGGNSSWGRE